MVVSEEDYHMHYNFLSVLSLSIRWMKNVSLEVTATCFHPAEIRGQRVQDVSVFTSCPEKGKVSPPDETVVAIKPPKLDKQKPRHTKTPVHKVRPVTPKAKSHKPSKTRPQAKVVAIKVAKNKKLKKKTK